MYSPVLAPTTRLADVGVAFNRDCDHAAGAGGDFLDVAERFFVLEDRVGIVGVLRGDTDYGEGFVDEKALGPCLISPAR